MHLVLLIGVARKASHIHVHVRTDTGNQLLTFLLELKSAIMKELYYYNYLSKFHSVFELFAKEVFDVANFEV